MTLGYHQFEHLLLTHCTPTLIKRKLGSMFHLDNRYSDVHELVEYYDQILNLQGLRINLFFSHGRYTVYVYLPSSLKYLMTNKDIQSGTTSRKSTSQTEISLLIQLLFT